MRNVGVTVVVTAMLATVAGASGERVGASSPQPAASIASLPLSFEPNRGQAPPSIRYLARARGGSVGIRSNELLLSLRGASMRLRMLGANPRATLDPADELPGKVNYLYGNDPSKWLTGLPTYARLLAREVYPGIDAVYYGRDGRLEYDFVVHAGSDPSSIRLDFRGARYLRVETDGTLRVAVGARTLRQPPADVYQVVDGDRRAVPARFVIRNGRVRFAVGPYDHGRDLTIDPGLVYSTYLGGSSGDSATDVATDAAHNMYLAGVTSSSDFPTHAAAQPALAMSADAFVSKLNAAGDTLLYSTYLGGTREERDPAIAVDAVGSAYVGGTTASTNFPTLHPFQSTNHGGHSQGFDGFVAKLDASGAPVYSTYLGGNDDDYQTGLDVTPAGEPVAIGNTASPDFPTTPGSFQPTHAGFENDIVVTKFDSTGSGLVFSTYFGNPGEEFSPRIALDASGNVFMTGVTGGSPPLVNPYQAANKGFYDGFVAKLAASGASVVYSTLLGGTGWDNPDGIAVDPTGRATVVGYTRSFDFPTKNAFQPAKGSTFSLEFDAFVTTLTPAGNDLVYSTYLGGDGDDIAAGVAADAFGNAYVVGGVGAGSDSDFPTVNPNPLIIPGNGYFARFAPTGMPAYINRFTGGPSSATVDADGNLYIAGAAGAGFQTVLPYQSTYGGLTDAFIAKLQELPTAVAVTGLRARLEHGKVVVRWRTPRAWRALGFNVLSRPGAARLNRTLIPATHSGAYSWVDRRPRRSGRSFWLEVVRADGSGSLFGPAVLRR